MINQMSIYDPWNETNKINEIINTTKRIKIKGPKNKDGYRNDIKFHINVSLPKIIIQTVEDDGNIYLHLDIDITDKSAKIVRVDKYEGIYSGRDLMKLGLKLLKNIGIEKVILEDFSEIECENRNIFKRNFKNMIFPKKYLILLFLYLKIEKHFI
jgi:hypothetical protein